MFRAAYTNLHPTIKLTGEVSDHNVIMLDADVQKGDDFPLTTCSELDVWLFEKKMAAHLFIPQSSEHPVAVIRASINGFLKQSVPAVCQHAAIELVVVAAIILCETASHDT